MAPPAELLPGMVVSRVDDAELVVLLSGDVDLCHQEQLAGLARCLARHDGRLVVDLADVTFCDGTLAAFLAETLGRGVATVRAPTRLTQEFLTLYGLPH